MSTAAEVSAAAGVPREDHDPFEVLRNANTVLLHNLRRDEVSPELQKQLTTIGMASSSQAYFCDPYTKSYLGPQVFCRTVRIFGATTNTPSCMRHTWYQILRNTSRYDKETGARTFDFEYFSPVF